MTGLVQFFAIPFGLGMIVIGAGLGIGKLAAGGAHAPLVLGLIGGTAEWVFRKSGILSVTVSAADRLVDVSAEALAALLWRDVARAYDLGNAALPPWRIVKEKRATFAATPAELSM